MIALSKIVWEAIVQAYQSMTGNRLRTILSLLGITIGIFCIIAVKSAVDSLQDNIVEGISELGSDMIYIDRQPWNEDPNQNYWKYLKRPDPSYEDYKMLRDRLESASLASYAIVTGGRTIKYRSNSVTNAFILGATPEYQEMQGLQIADGRYFSSQEMSTGHSAVILGANVAASLFEELNPLGKDVRLFGQKYQVIGVLEEEGDNMFNFINYDDVIWISYNNIKRFVSVKQSSQVGKLLNVKVADGIELATLKDEATGLLRQVRRLRPREDDNFAINELSMLTDLMGKIFGVMNIAGGLIGAFSLIVGMFSVANIMFVSVKERTSIIGVKKALGAKRFMILLEFLIEAMVLCLIGGLIGLAVVYVVLKGITVGLDFPMSLSPFNVALGIVTSIIVGIIAGLLPALRASKMDPVEAIRS
jgi:putative ABC transport system permease protein